MLPNAKVELTKTAKSQSVFLVSTSVVHAVPTDGHVLPQPCGDQIRLGDTSLGEECVFPSRHKHDKPNKTIPVQQPGGMWRLKNPPLHTQ